MHAAFAQLFRNDATQPEFPIVKPMKTFRGEKLTHDVAEQIMQGWLGSERMGRKSITPGSRVAGQNPAYDHFPAQYQIWYAGKARNSFWYNPVFKVNTLDGKSVWRRSDYRCKREDTPGTRLHSHSWTTRPPPKNTGELWTQRMTYRGRCITTPAPPNLPDKCTSAQS